MSAVRRQSGQAIVLVALTLVVLFGMIGLAVDGGRAYIDRRELQDAVDAAVLAAGDNYELQGDLNSAASKSANWYGLNAHIASYGSFSSASATCPSSFPAGSTCTSYTWSGYPGGFTFGYFKNSFNGTIFSGSANHRLPVAFMQVLGVGPLNTYTAVAQAVVGNQWQTPALLTLGQQGCNGNSGASLKIQGSVNVTITGDVYSNGDLVDQNGTPVTVNGSIYADCNSLPSGWTYTGTAQVPGAPVLPDPAYTTPNQSLYNTPSPTSPPGNAVELKPGVYNTDPQFTSAVCHFLDPGVYSFPNGYTNNGGLVSNELRPPIEPLWDTGMSPATINYTRPAGPQFWAQNAPCAGDFYATAVPATGGKPLKPAGAWGVEVTAVREDSWNGPSGSGTYLRQSAPSMCHALQTGMNGTSHGMQVVIGNVPGATGYYIYADPNGCEANNQGNFGFMGYVPNPVAEDGSGSGCGNLNQLPGYPNSPPAPNNTSPVVNGAVSGTGYGPCKLGWVASQIFDNNQNNPTGYIAFNANSNSQWSSTAQCPAAQFNNPGPSTTLPPNGCAPPDGEQAPAGSGLANEVPVRQVTPFGDRGDENQCRPQGTSSNPCAGATVTPGAVQFYFPPNACISQQGNGSTYAFSGYQYNWIVLYAPGNTSPPSPPTPNSCSGNTLTGNSATTFIGTIYMPTASITVNGSNRAPVAGQVIVYNALIDGSAGVAIAYNPAVAPAPPAARLIL